MQGQQNTKKTSMLYNLATKTKLLPCRWRVYVCAYLSWKWV